MNAVYTPHHHLHATDQIIINGQPWLTEELPARAEIILQAIKTAKIGEIIPPQDFGVSPIEAVHEAGFLSYLQSIYQQNLAVNSGKSAPVFPTTFATRPVRHTTRSPDGLKGYYCFEIYTPIVEGTWIAAYWSAQCALTAARLIQQGSRSAYALCRPPGHHAAQDLYGGFCFLNNVAIAAKSFNSHTAILDIDYHHGNGTQEIFYQDPNTLYCSLHADPDEEYPFFWGGSDEMGAGPGLGTNFNFPLPRGTGDDIYLATLDKALSSIRNFKPDVLLVSLGLDIAPDDPAGGFTVSLDAMQEIGRRIAGLNLPTLIVQEGGYHLALLGQYAVAFLRAFI